MQPPLLIVLSITSFWLFSPEALVLIGNGGGGGAGIGVVVVLCFAAITLVGSSFIEDENWGDENRQRLCKQKTDLIGLIGMAGMIGTALFASTGILVTSGFTFNEVFYYRFPNFGFAFLLLIAALMTQFLPVAIKNTILVISVCCCFAGLAALTVYGLISEPTVPLHFISEKTSVMSWLPLLLIFVGIDRISVILRQQPLPFRISFFMSVFLLACWLFVSARYVEPQRLVFSTIPYMTAAWKIAGEPGRLIMGMVVISGSFGAVFGLMSVGALSVRKLLAGQWEDYLEKGIIVVMAIAIGGMMAAGVAGTIILEMYIRTSLLLWLVYTALSIFYGSFKMSMKKKYQAGIGLVSSTIILLCSLTIFFNQEKVVAAALFAASMITGSVLLITFLNVISGYRRSDDVPTIKKTEV
jgi:hypothetical protein